MKLILVKFVPKWWHTVLKCLIDCVPYDYSHSHFHLNNITLPEFHTQVHDVSLEEISQAFCIGNKLSKGEGKSMAEFMVSTDKRFCMKTINSSEKTMLLNMLPSYFEHIMKYSKTSLLCRMLGLFRLRYGGVDTFFLLMMNISRQDVSCRRIVTSFDLKGSLRSRRVRTGEKRSVMKDINWVRFFWQSVYSIYIERT